MFLVVDDDVNLSRLAGMILENSGQYEVMIVNESARALAAAIQFRPEVMLLDVDMPGMSGGDLAREAALDSRLRDIPILFLTGLVSHEETAGTARSRAGEGNFSPSRSTRRSSSLRSVTAPAGRARALNRILPRYRLL